MCDCKNPQECKRKAEKWKANQSKFLPTGEQEHENFLKKLKGNTATIETDAHFTKRSQERAVSTSEVLSVIENGWAVERNQSVGKASIVLLGYVGKNYRPLHVVVNQLSDSKWLVLTCYDPRSHAWKWTETFDERKCFCNDDSDV